ncbi:2Fe-2S iron-sulfur cluster-binding protein [Albibacterium bauzanense]|uniref:2Fe-2S ferredoxin n=1 Tax=Albibacterium bauzanense TaxID=653929 RepID=A0A4R1M0T3_9SPHI|nr:2Fe-2S iron-sulfur cluster-binding protein [Albibacterium bauzanense]TCK84822.1 2Fe-2S ferredoxin [Albibacterium bauzanense]
MENDLINITVEDQEGTVRDLEIPTDISLSLMEVLKASEYDILATCGGMALCATCHIQVLDDFELPEPGDDEADMLDTLHNAQSDSRLSCQIRITPALQGMRIKIIGAE